MTIGCARHLGRSHRLDNHQFAPANVTVNPGAGFAEIDEQAPNHFLGKGATLQTQDSATARSTISWTWSGAANAAAIVLEVKAAALLGGPGPGPSQ